MIRVAATEPIRQLVEGAAPAQKRYLVIAEANGDTAGHVVQVEAR